MDGNGISRCIENQGALPPDTRRVRHSRPTPRRKAFRLWTPDQPYADWMGGNGLARCITSREPFPRHPASAVSPADTNEQEYGSCTPIHE
jgi:hypothetical protein